MDIRALIDELDKLGEVSDDQASAALDRLDTLERQKATASQVARYGALGGVAGAGVGALRNAISGTKNSWRGAIGNAVGGAITAGAVPVLQKHLDQRAEEGTLRDYLKENSDKTAAGHFKLASASRGKLTAGITDTVSKTIKHAFATNEASGPMNPGYNSGASRQQGGYTPRADRGGSPVSGGGFSPTRGGFMLASGVQGPVGFYRKQAEAKKLKEKDSESLETYIPYSPGDFKKAKLANAATKVLETVAARPELALAAAGTVAGAATAGEGHRGEGALSGASTGLTLGSLGSAFMGKKLAFKLQGHTNHQGLEIAIENRKGSVRKGVDKDGKPWRTEMKHPYGYIKSSKGADGEEVDCYVGPVKDAPEAHVVHQHKSDGKGYDEDKVMLGFNSKEEAREAYLKHYNDPKFLGPMKSVPIERLKELIESGKKLIKISALPGAKKFSKPGALGDTGRSIEQTAKPFGFGRAGAVAGTLKNGNL